LCRGREYHHIASAAILRDDKMIDELFSADEINIMAEAIEDHRASGSSAPRTLYGRIVAEADRVIDGNVILRRTVQYGLSNYPALSREEHFIRVCEHLHEKYAEGGYLKLWIPESGNAENLRLFRKIIDDKQQLRRLFDAIFDEETDGYM
ncbi:MAG: phosphohydrolase, partial [Bacteroidaceae bacterium]|nr:phosphohydrolase [Bacteroidaceae bacterium]